MKKTKQPGENISLKTKKNEDPSIMNWINAQTNLMDSLRYLIEKEVFQNGVRNLQTFIPAERNVQAMLTVQEAREETAISIEEPQLEQVLVDDDIDEEDIEAWI